MQDLDDLTLLREYAARGSEAAFAELVSRRVGFVYSAALRQVRDPHLAGEITQAVFMILAQKAGRISDQTILAGWLFKTTRYAAIAQARDAAKRSLRTAAIEKEFQMQSEIQASAPDALWEKMSPLLDEALATLGETDRQAVLLRFFENKSLAEVGGHLGMGEDTARKRVARALEKLHRYFRKRGVSSTTAILAGAISANSVQAAPVALAKAVTATAFAKGAAASGSTLILVKGASKAMTWANAKMGIAIGMGVLLAAVTTAITIKENQKPSHAAYEYEADGTFDGERHLLLGDVQKWDPVSFKLYVRDNQWLIHITQPNSHIKYGEIGFDGKTMYYSSVLDENAVANVNPKPNLWGGDISFDSVPFNGDEPHIPIIWLALASSHYLDEAKDHLLPPYSTDFMRVRLPASVARMNNLPKLPQTIIFFDDGFDRREGVPQKRPPPYDKGFTNAIYTVNTFTNIGDYSLPLSFNLKVFVPAYSGFGTVLYEEYNGTVGNMSGECSLTNFIPVVVGAGLIGDTRFVSADGIRKTRFDYETNRWLSTNEVDALPGFSNYTIMERLHKNQSSVFVTHGKLPLETLTPVQSQELNDLQKVAVHERQTQMKIVMAAKKSRNISLCVVILGFGVAFVFMFLRCRRK